MCQLQCLFFQNKMHKKQQKLGTIFVKELGGYSSIATVFVKTLKLPEPLLAAMAKG